MKEPCALLLAEYAAGTMDDERALIVASYLSFCRDSRAYVTDCQKMAGTMLETLCEPVGMTEGSLQRVLGRLEEAAPCAGKREKMNLCGDTALPAPLAALLCGCDSKKLRWKNAGGGSRTAQMPHPCGQTQIVAMDVAPGKPLPQPAHDGMVLTLVLRGAYNDETGHYTAGTLAIYDAGADSHPVADARQGCVCISAIEGMTCKDGPVVRFFSRWKR